MKSYQNISFPYIFRMFVRYFVEAPVALIYFESCWVQFGQFRTPCFGQFLPPFLEDPLKLIQIGCGLSVNCELQVAPQIFLSNFQALAEALRVIQRLVLKPLVLAVCFGLLPCWKVNFWQCVSLILCNGACFSFKVPCVFSSLYSFFKCGQFPTVWQWEASLKLYCSNGISQLMSGVSGTWHPGRGPTFFSNDTRQCF